MPRFLPLHRGTEPDAPTTAYVREVPDASSIWLHIASAFFTTAVALAISALTLTSGATVTLTVVLLAVAGLFVVIAVICLLAQWDSNRGRKAKAFEIGTGRPP